MSDLTINIGLEDDGKLVLAIVAREVDENWFRIICVYVPSPEHAEPFFKDHFLKRCELVEGGHFGIYDRNCLGADFGLVERIEMSPKIKSIKGWDEPFLYTHIDNIPVSELVINPNWKEVVK